MSHSFTVTTLNSIGSESRRRGDPLYYLNRLSPIHVRWHMGTFNTRTVGFLAFHWHVIENLKKSNGETIWQGGVTPFTGGDFTRFGHSYNVTTVAQRGDINTLANFSRAMESWHNEAHMAVGMADHNMGTMMDPARNIYLRDFWRLHYFINDRFLEQLTNYDPTGSVQSRINRIERNQHADVGRI
jgi:hypothetical protein